MDNQNSNKKVWLIVLFVVIALGGLYFIQVATTESLIQKYGFEGMSVENVLANLENDLDEGEELSSSVYGDRLELREGNRTETIPIPEDKFYLSIAPYINQTHECGIHSLISCRGELANKEIQVDVIDTNGNVVYSQQQMTYENGFAGIWLPKNIVGVVSVTYDNKTAAVPIDTANDSLTCITTLKLT